MRADKAELKHIPVDCLSRGRFQPRRVFDKTALHELADSIKATGLVQPIVVRPIDDQHYEIVAGERRWRAAQLAGLDTVICLVKSFNDEQTAAVSTIENVQREDLNPIEEAKAYQRLIDDFNYLHEEIAAMVGKSRARITNSLRLLRLDESVQQLLIQGDLSEGHGKMLAGLSVPLQRELAHHAVQRKWSVRKLEQQVKQLSQQAAIRSDEHIHITYLERQLRDKVGSEVKLETDPGQSSGWVKIRYFNNDTLAGLAEKLGVEPEDL